MWDGKERRKIWDHLSGKPFAIRRFVTKAPLIDGAAYGVEMVERRKIPDRRMQPSRKNNIPAQKT